MLLLYSKDTVFENLWLYEAEEQTRYKTHFLKTMKLWLNATMRRSRNYLKSIVFVLLHMPEFKCKISRTSSFSVCQMKGEGKKVPAPQSENRWKCRIGWGETGMLWGKDHEIAPSGGQTYQTSASSASPFTSKLNPMFLIKYFHFILISISQYTEILEEAINKCVNDFYRLNIR